MAQVICSVPLIHQKPLFDSFFWSSRSSSSCCTYSPSRCRPCSKLMSDSVVTRRRRTNAVQITLKCGNGLIIREHKQEYLMVLDKRSVMNASRMSKSKGGRSWTQPAQLRWELNARTMAPSFRNVLLRYCRRRIYGALFLCIFMNIVR